MTDLLIGDLFDDRVDEVWGPMETLYGDELEDIPAWNEEAPELVAATKENEWFYPTGPLR